jgi:hypothetical protein
MIREGISKMEEQCPPDPSIGGILMMLCIATSIDSLAVGLSLAMLEAKILYALLIIMFVTFFICSDGHQSRRFRGSQIWKTDGSDWRVDFDRYRDQNIDVTHPLRFTRFLFFLGLMPPKIHEAISHPPLGQYIFRVC